MVATEAHHVDATTNKRKVRSRSGCLPCRRKRKKCDERKPVCERCTKSSGRCHWDSAFQFRSENAFTIAGVERGRLSRRFQNSSSQQASNAGSDASDNQHSVAGVIQQYQLETADSSLTDTQDDNLVSPSQLSNHNVGKISAISNEDISLRQQSHQSPLELQTAVHMPGPQVSWDSQANLAISMQPVSNVVSNESPQFSRAYLQGMASDTSPGISADGIFEPGSRYEELHQTLRSQILQAAQSAPSSRRSSQQELDVTTTPYPNDDASGTRTPPEVTREDELVLWENWVNEIATWLDKFSPDKYFQHVLPVLAKGVPHLRYSMLALSARQLERKENSVSPSMSLSLYHWAIHLLLPELHTRDTSVLASCVILCVLEMFSCSPKAWRRHLDGCAGLIQSMDIHVDSGGIEGSLFICFARMDVWGGLISSGHTLIDIDKWTSNNTFDEDMRMYKSSSRFEHQACYICYLLARVMNLISPNSEILTQSWIDLFVEIEEWYTSRPVAMQAVLYLPQKEDDVSNPFPTIVFTNDAAISGNQLYHTAAILMMQKKPPRLKLPKTKSMLWHARQICAISVSNKQKGALTNAVQPLYVAGKLMSHPSEHRAIVELYDRIERETGWGASWRADDLREHWGDMS